MRSKTIKRPLTGIPVKDTDPAWQDEALFLLSTSANSFKTETTYRSGLRLFADWLQHFGKAGYDKKESWPLTADQLSNQTLIEYRQWLTANRSSSTVTTYMAAVLGYLVYLEDRDMLPEAIQLGKLKRQLRNRRQRTNAAESVVDLDMARQNMPRILEYYNRLPLPPENDGYNRRLSLLRDRAVVNTMYSTAARISEIVSLNRSKISQGRADYAIITGKGNKNRTIHFREYAQKSIQAYLRERQDTNPALFVSHSRNSLNARLSITSAHKVVKKAVKALSLHPSLSAHDFRHFRATQLLREGMPIEVVQEFLGHADITTTRNIYAPVLGVQIVSEWLNNVDITPERAAQNLKDPDTHTPARQSNDPF